jgi:His/Glu/Gln/Arg/opine family amino acid ABC transporter permease subunit
MTFDVSVIHQYWPYFWRGFLMTVSISLVAPALALAIGALIAFLRLSRTKAVASAAAAVSEIVRDLPFIVFLFLIFYFLPTIGVKLPALLIGILTLGLYGGAYFSEIIRGAIQSVPPGQMESARSTGMSRLQAFRYIVIPQMMGYFIPPATNQAILVVKESAVLSTITVAELTMAGQVVQNYTYSPIEVFLVVSLLYWVLCAAFGRAGLFLERLVDPTQRKRTVSHA